MRRRNPAERVPHDFQRAVERYFTFHDLQPKQWGRMSKFSFPSQATRVGEAVHTMYRSDKWTGKIVNYIHEHGAGVEVYKPDARGAVQVPNWIRNAKTIVLLGRCQGVKYEGDDGDVELGQHVDDDSGPTIGDLYCTPDGDALIVVRGERPVLLLWGGVLSVEAEGIDG